MDPAVRLIYLCQGKRSLEDHTQDFLDLAYLTDFILPSLSFIVTDLVSNTNLNSFVMVLKDCWISFWTMSFVLDITFGEVEEDASPKYFGGHL